MRDFIDKHAEAFGERLVVKQVPGRPATLKFRNKEGEAARRSGDTGLSQCTARLSTARPSAHALSAGGDREDVRVDSWKTENMIQFLEKKLKAR